MESRAAIETAVSRFENRRVAVVFAQSYDRHITDRFLIGLRTEVLAGCADAIELVGAEPVFLNYDQFLEEAATRGRESRFDLVLHLPGTSTEFAFESLIPSVCAWIDRPIFPCNSRAATSSQNKLVGRTIAASCGWLVPRRLVTGSELPGAVAIAKPINGGDSIGLERGRVEDLREYLDSNDHIVEEFIEGYDATIYIYRSILTGEFEIVGISAVIPDDEDNRQWYWTTEDKLLSSQRGEYRYSKSPPARRVRFPASESLTQLARQTCLEFGVQYLARIDIRYTRKPEDGANCSIDSSYFLELNSMPTIAPNGSWIYYLHQHFSRHNFDPALLHPQFHKLPPVPATLISMFASWALFTPDFPQTAECSN